MNAYKYRAEVIVPREDEWILKDEEAALLAWKWGYWEPDADQERYLNNWGATHP